MAGKRKFKVRVRGKVRNQLLRRGGVAAGLAAGLLLAAWFSGAAIKASRGFVAGRLFSFRPSSVEVDCPSAAVASSARELLSGLAGTELTARRCVELSTEMLRRHPALLSARVERNFFTGKARLTAGVEKIVSPVLLDGATAYLGVSGRFMDEDLSGAPDPVFLTELRGPVPDPKALAAFIRNMSGLAGLFPSRPLRLECLPVTGCQFVLEDGSSVLWGEFEFNRPKVLRLNEVVKAEAARRGPPLRIDLRYFREGKIFVSAAK